MKYIVLITDVRFWESRSGDQARISSIIEHLSRKVNLTVVCTGPEINLTYKLAQIYQASFIFLEPDIILSSAEYLIKFKTLLNVHLFDAVIIEHIHNSYFLNAFDYDIKMILDCHDIVNERTKEFASFKYNDISFELSKEEEYYIFSIYDYIIVLCEPDFETLIRTIDSSKILLCPHPVKNDKIVVSQSAVNISFVGSGYTPNIDGINHFIETCWHKIHSQNEFNLNIYGGVCEYVISKDSSNINLKGYKKNLADIYRNTDICINPVRFGAGMKIKSLEALSYGVPLVTTKHGARGLEKANNNSFKIAESPEEFISTITSLSTDYNARLALSNNAYEFVTLNFNVDQCFKSLFNIL